MTPRLERFRRYPLPRPLFGWLDAVAIRCRTGGVVRCLVCGRLTLTRVQGPHLRETCLCRRCGAYGRQRQVAWVACAAVERMRGQPVRSLRDLARRDDLVVYNTEARGAVHGALAGMTGYVCSEYFGPPHRSGDRVNGVLCQDLMALSLASDSVDVMLSADVFEHVPDAYRAHQEVYRVLRRGGCHVFTVPFDQTEFLDDQRAVMDASGSVTHLKEPIYHADPLRPQDGALVYRIFALEMLVRLRQIGFRTHLYQLYQPLYGILGPNGLVFEAIKP